MKFSINESLKFGWEKTRAHSGIIFQVLLTLFALEVAQAVVSRVLPESLLGFLAYIAVSIAEFVVGVGMTVIMLRLAEGKHAEYKNILPPGELVWRYFLATLVTCLIVVIGLILFIIPGMYFAVRLSMVRYLVIEGMGVRDALRKSGEMTERVKWRLFGFFIVVALLNILGAIFLLIGLLVTIPVTMIAYAHIYQKLKHHRAA